MEGIRLTTQTSLWGGGGGGGGGGAGKVHLGRFTAGDRFRMVLSATRPTQLVYLRFTSGS